MTPMYEKERQKIERVFRFKVREKRIVRQSDQNWKKETKLA